MSSLTKFSKILKHSPGGKGHDQSRHAGSRGGGGAAGASPAKLAKSKKLAAKGWTQDEAAQIKKNGFRVVGNVLAEDSIKKVPGPEKRKSQ